MFRIVIIDDETDAVEVIVKLLNSIQTIPTKIVGVANNLEKGIKIITSNAPDIVFLDIEMPGRKGLEIYNFFPKPDFKIIFITAYSQYAISALKKSASDYLLKPINLIELKESLSKAADQIKYENQKEIFTIILPKNWTTG